MECIVDRTYSERWPEHRGLFRISIFARWHSKYVAGSVLTGIIADFQYLDTKDSNSVRVFVERTPGVRDSEPVMRWNAYWCGVSCIIIIDIFIACFHLERTGQKWSYRIWKRVKLISKQLLYTLKNGIFRWIWKIARTIKEQVRDVTQK